MTPLNALGEAELCPGASVLAESTPRFDRPARRGRTRLTYLRRQLRIGLAIAEIAFGQTGRLHHVAHQQLGG